VDEKRVKLNNWMLFSLRNWR